ncbi:hypothetical protein ACSSV1_000428 [Labrenzia sp. MBR-25]|jgi:hypothetical protein
MGPRAIILVAMAILGIAMLSVWQFAPAVLADQRGLMDGERLEMLVARVGLWRPVQVVIGAGIFALTGQIAELAGPLFPLSFVVGAIVTAFSAYICIKRSKAYPSAGGIGMILKKAYGPTTVAAGAALLMAPAMVVNESRVARTFGTYTLRAFGGNPDSVLVPILGVGVFLARNPVREGAHDHQKNGLELPASGSRKLKQEIERLANHGARSSSRGP